MSPTRAYSDGKVAILGLVAGWATGMVWWTGLMIAFGPSTIVRGEGGQVVEEERSMLSGVVWAPLVAIPWAVVGFIAGGFTAHFRGYWAPATTVIGAIAGFTYSAATSPFDGWLTITMPIACLGGALGSLFVSFPIRYVLGLIRGWETS